MGIDLELNLDYNLERSPEAIELSIIRIVQEGLNNVRKLAMANKIEVFLQQPSMRALMRTIADIGGGLLLHVEIPHPRVDLPVKLANESQ